MGYELNGEDYQQIINGSDDARYDYFLEEVVKHQEVWSLADGDEWIMVVSEGDECLPIWPHPDFAESWAKGDWSDCEPRMIDLDSWMKRWIPGMEKDGTLLAVFPNEKEEGLVVAPNELHDSLIDVMERNA